MFLWCQIEITGGIIWWKTHHQSALQSQWKRSNYCIFFTPREPPQSQRELCTRLQVIWPRLHSRTNMSLTWNQNQIFIGAQLTSDGLQGTAILCMAHLQIALLQSCMKEPLILRERNFEKEQKENNGLKIDYGTLFKGIKSHNFILPQQQYEPSWNGGVANCLIST